MQANPFWYMIFAIKFRQIVHVKFAFTAVADQFEKLSREKSVTLLSDKICYPVKRRNALDVTTFRCVICS